MTAARSELAAERGIRPIRGGISACRLGEQARFDGGYKRDTFLAETFRPLRRVGAGLFGVECGFVTPREAMRLVRVENGVRLLTVKTGIDLTAPMERYSRSRVSALVAENLSGYVLKKDSPSCGLERVSYLAGQLATRRITTLETANRLLIVGAGATIAALHGLRPVTVEGAKTRRETLAKLSITGHLRLLLGSTTCGNRPVRRANQSVSAVGKGPPRTGVAFGQTAPSVASARSVPS